MGRANKYKPPTLEELQQEAAKYQTRGDFSRTSPKHYRYAWCNGLLEQICAHMPDLRQKWTTEQILAEATKYKTRTEFQRKNHRAYQAARHRKILDEVCAHMK